ncbi:MAG: hypothetical protein QOJ20_1257 [Mycobacterium sp.]|jgi:NAD(P)-dependent dehydrogenase (short-subunit alcohol dehydrogenase family)|nr:hypothetical protein [Mycobacterium sp.]
MVAMQLTDAVVLVTGASAGIGHAAAARFAARGAHVLVHGRDPERTGDVAREVSGTALRIWWRIREPSTCDGGRAPATSA